MSPASVTTYNTDHRRRLRAAVKLLVIELGYLEYCLTQGI